MVKIKPIKCDKCKEGIMHPKAGGGYWECNKCGYRDSYVVSEHLV